MPATLQPFASPYRMPSLAAAALPRRVRDALQAVLALVFDHVAGPLERALDELEHQLQRSAEQADDLALRVQRLGQLRALQRNRDRLGTRFIDLLEAELATIREPVVPAPALRSAEAGASPTWELRLLEDDEASEDALLRAVTIRYEARAGLPLQLLGHRFGVLAARPAFDAEQLPVGPHRLTVLLSEASSALEISAETRLELLHAFERRVLANFEELALVMNDTLIRHNVLPSMTFVPLRTRPRLRDDAGVAEPPIASAGPAAGDAAGPTASSFDFMQQLLGRRRGLIERLRASGGLAHAHSEVVPTEQIVAALVPLQGRPLPPIDRLRDELQRRFEASGAGTISATDADVFELFGLMYAQIDRQLRPDSLSTALLGRLQASVLRAALQDHTFFDRPQHPARQLLETVAAPGVIGTTDDDLDPQLRSALERAVDQVIEQDVRDPRVFEAANEALREQLRALARRSEVAERRQVEAARGKERLADARGRAAGAIGGLLGDRRLPRVLHSLIHQAWVDVLTLTLLRHDDDSAEWSAQLETTGQIIAVAGGAPPPPGLDASIRDALTRIGYHEDEAAAIAAYLGGGTALDDDTAASRTELVMRLKARARLGAQALSSTPAFPPLNPDEQAQLELLGTMRTGGEFEFVDETCTPVRRRLAWIGPITNNALFVNRRGQRAAEFSLDALARMLANGTVRRVGEDGRGVVDRAWDATLTALRQFGTGTEEAAP